MTLFLSPSHPVPYQFSCGTKSQTMILASLYVKRMKLCERAYSADARLYNYLSRGSDLGMLVGKEDTWELPEDLLVIDEEANPSPQFDDSNIVSIEEEDTDVTASLYEASRSPSLVDSASTHPSEEYIPLPYIDMQNCYPLSGATSATSGDSLPSSDEFLANCSDVTQSPVQVSPVLPVQDTTPPPVVPQQPRHVMNGAYDAWRAEGHGVQGPTPSAAGRTQRLTLSTTSRELQQYMTVDASNTPTCKECGSSFPKRGNLARHIQTVHMKLKPFQCDHCHASFGYKNHLKRHQIVHQRGGEFKCKVCNREFKGQVQLTRHIQQAHQNVASIDLGSEPRAEEVERTRVSCDICGVSFSQKSNLSRHRLIHEGLRFVCPFCPSQTSFGQRYDLHRHIQRKHPGVAESAFVSLAPERIGQVE